MTSNIAIRLDDLKSGVEASVFKKFNFMARSASAASEIFVPSPPQISDTTISSSFGVLFAPIASSAPSPQLPIRSSCVQASDKMISGKCGLDAALLRVLCRNLKQLLEVPIEDLQFFALISPQLHSTLRKIRPQ
jgi:hypothetical protein